MAKLVWQVSQLMPVRSRLVWVLVLSTLGGLSGWVPELSPDLSRVTIASSAYAQDLIAKIPNYARVVKQLGPLRREYLQRVRGLIGPTATTNVCQEAQSYQAVKVTCDEFFSKAAILIQQNGLTNWEFNYLTHKINTTPFYQQRFDDEYRKL